MGFISSLSLFIGSFGQNGPLASILKIFGPETLFGKYIGKYHFVVLELGELEYPIFLFQVHLEFKK